MIYNLFTWLGLFLLYMPPLMVFINKPLLNKYHTQITFKRLAYFSGILYLLMMYLMAEAWIAFTFYLVAFLFFFGYSSRLFDKALSFRLSVYVCFMVAVLWEWPIQLVYPQNLDAVIMSLFKAVSIPLFFYELKEIGFHLHPRLIKYVFYPAIVGVGFVCLFVISPSSIYNQFVFIAIHLYRLPWFIFCLACINITAKTIYNEAEYNTRLFTG